MQHSPPPPGPDAVLTADLLLAIHTQAEVGRALAAAVAAGARLGAPFALAFLPYDPGAGAWHLTALLAPDGSPAPLDTFGVPLGPLTLGDGVRADGDRVQPLAAVFGAAWGEESCRRLEETLGVRGVLVCSLGPDARSTSALVALLNEERVAPVVSRLLSHTALAVDRVAPEHADAPDRVLSPEALARHLNHEVARAQRYVRPLSIVYAELRSHDEAARAGPMIGHRLRRWDAIGRLEGEAPVLLTVLPETSGHEAALFVRRNQARFGAAQPGVAAMPDDGTTVERLLAAARTRSVADQRDEHQPAGEIWIREGSSQIAWQGRLPDQVRCPTCSALYLRPRRTGATAAESEEQRAAARAALAALCPDHGEQVVV